MAGLAAPLTLIPTRAEAFSTRVHIMIANAVREAMIAAGDGSIPLRMSDRSVVLPQQDFEAIRDYPLAFRAGAVGPDNMVFPGMTDPSHALGQHPYDQCELLYQAAVNGEERAYALGCFLHGATDAIAHHYVNYMSGETFTLTPITSAREQGFANVVRHILAESAIQQAAYDLDPDAFSTSKLLHTIPVGFVLRTYLDQDAPLWQLMSSHALAEYEAVRAQMPAASLPSVVAAMDVGPADHLVLTPVYLAEVDALIAAKQAELEAEIASMQDPNSPQGSQLLVTPGPDGELGTKDDQTDCTLTCATLYAKYFTYTGLLAPRYDANNNPLPSAFEKITDELRAELLGFHPAYLETVGNLSAKLNEPLTGEDPGFGVTKAELAGLFGPLTGWADDITTIDYDTLVYAVVPDWIISLDTALQTVGLDVDLAGILQAVFEPIVAPIKDAIEQAFIAEAEVFIGQLIDEYDAAKATVTNEYDARLAAAADPALDGDMLDHFYASGLYTHAFNITAATFANHDAVLPVAGAGREPGGVGPASFDASYTPAWMQAGVCPYLAEHVFPLGLDAEAAFSVRIDGVDYPGQLGEDSPVECHAGSLTMFAGTPTLMACALTSLAELLDAPVGSLSRAYPPEFAINPVSCVDTEIPGLPAPPPGGDGDGDPSGDGDGDATGDGDPTAGEGTGGPGLDGGSGEESGCACTAGSSEPAGRSGGGLAAFGLLGLLGLSRSVRRKRARTAGVAASLLGLGLLSGCGDDGANDSDVTSIGETGDPTGDGDGDPTGDGDGDPSTGDGDGDPTGDGDGDPTTTGDGDGDPDGVVALLDGTVWHGEQTRNGKTRAYELKFDVESLLWSEIRNPYGPARLRELRSFTVGPDGDSVSSTVISPQGWPIHPENGRMDDWSFELIETSPRILAITRDGVTEEFEEGAWPVPDSGLTAIVRVFEVGGVVDQAFCDSGANGFDYKAIFDFAHGQSNEIVATDVVAGAQLLSWSDPTNNNQFSITDVDGFDRHGGTELSDSFNFFVTYVGAIDHPGGSLGMREQDDSVEDAVWVFLDDAVGSDNVNDLFLEVHGFVWFDNTPDEPSVNLPGGDVPIEAILVRCTEQITDVDVEIEFQGAGWEPVGLVGSTPEINTTLFPPAL